MLDKIKIPLSNIKLPGMIKFPTIFENKLLKTWGTDSYKYFEKDAFKCLEDWQYYEPISIAFEDRYDLDKEAYLKTFFDPEHLHDVPFDEKILIERLIKNLKPAKHPVFIEYKKFLENLLQSLSSNRILLTFEDFERILKEQYFIQCKDYIPEGHPFPATCAGKQVNIVSPFVLYFLFGNNAYYTDYVTKENHPFKGTIFSEAYSKGYLKGIEDFRNEYAVTTNTLYSSEGKAYIENLRYNYNAANITGYTGSNSQMGWSYWHTQFPLLLSDKVLYEYGYYAAYISEVWALVKKHPNIFNSFYHTTSSRSENNNPIQKLSVKQIALIHVYEGKQITRQNASSITAIHGHSSGQKLFQSFTFFSSASNRKGEPDTALKLKNKIALLESVLMHLTDEAKMKAQNDLLALKKHAKP